MHTFIFTRYTSNVGLCCKYSTKTWATNTNTHIIVKHRLLTTTNKERQSDRRKIKANSLEKWSGKVKLNYKQHCGVKCEPQSITRYNVIVNVVVCISSEKKRGLS